jgi:Ni,Fe-hydrogenase I small subunit
MKNKHIEFDCVTLAKILGISNEGPIVFEVKVIPTINGFVYDEDVIMHTGMHDFASSVNVKSQDLMLRPKVLHRSITHNILSKRGHYNEVRFTNMC